MANEKETKFFDVEIDKDIQMIGIGLLMYPFLKKF